MSDPTTTAATQAFQHHRVEWFPPEPPHSHVPTLLCMGCGWHTELTGHADESSAGLEHRIEAALAAQEVTDAGQISDGYHTFDELYEYRMLYNAHAAHSWLGAGFQVVKSWRHSDGEKCFGGGWFIVTAELPTGQVSNHYAAEHWGLFDVPEVELPPAYDGHTPQEAATRLRAALTAARKAR